jgi:uncharacterized membrane protein YccC
MIPLSTRAKEAIKTGLAMVIVYGVAMQMGWDKPYWAGFTVVTINVLSAGVSLSRGMARSLGTLVGAVVALLIIGLFPQERWSLMLCASLCLGFCTYMLTGKSRSYFWFLVALTFLIIIAVNSPPDAETAFQLAQTRTSETAMGALVYTLVAFFLWPRSSVGEFNEISRKLWATQVRLYRAYRGLIFGEGTAEDSRPLRMQEIQLSAQAELLLGAAIADSYQVWEVRHQWRRFQQQSTALMESLERWRQSFAEIRPLNLTKLLPDLEAGCSELDLRFEQIKRMLAGDAPTRAPQPISFAVDRDELRSLTSFEKGALVVYRAQLENLERLSRSLYDCISDIRGYGRQAAEHVTPTARRRVLAIDPDRLEAVIRVVATLWIAFLLWVYIDPPGGGLFVMMATIFAVIMAMVPQASPLMLFLSWVGGGVFAGVLYVFVMPHLSGFVELAGLIFVAFFVMHYLLGEPRQTVARMFAMASFLVLISIDNQQTYSFSQYANSLAWLMLSVALAAVTTYIPVSPRPEKVFLRLLRRFFRHAEFLISAVGLEGEHKKGIAARWKAVLYRNDLLELPGKLATYSQQMDYGMLGGTTPQQVQALVASLYGLAHRVNDLIEARGLPQADLVKQHLLDDLRAWREVINERLRLRADPTQAIRPVADRLAALLTRMEARINETFVTVGEGVLSTEDYRNFYRLLGSYRGLSETLVDYATEADGIDWVRFREERF